MIQSAGRIINEEEFVLLFIYTWPARAGMVRYDSTVFASNLTAHYLFPTEYSNFKAFLTFVKCTFGKE